MDNLKIKILPLDIINKIAAGEIIERPACVVKELIENSLDAGSKSITVEIQKAGKKSIKIIDDGMGMSRKDAEIACLSHSTSKIRDLNDLQKITTLGFRGEALASIASVCHLEIITAMAKEQTGYYMFLEAGQIKEKRIAARNPGTTVIVRDLFFNTPARRKFYKTDTTELAHIVETVSRFIISFTGVGFKLVHADRIIFDISAGLSLKERISCVLGKFAGENLIPLNYSDELVSFRGYVSKPGYSRTDRKKQIFFVNKRYIRNAVLSHALSQSYRTLLERGKYSLAVVFVSINPSLVDINIHPRKLEVKFLPSKNVHDKFVNAVSNLLKNLKDKSTIKNYNYTEIFKPETSKENNYVFTGDFSYDGFKTISRKEPFDEPVWYQTVGNNYIVQVYPLKIIITDQHAAHERILFERFSKANCSKKPEKQNLLLPYTVDLSAEEVLVLKEHINTFNNFGFEIEPFGQNSFNIQSVPAVLKEKEIKKVFLEILDDIKKLPSKTRIDEEIIKIMSCRFAVKAGDKLNNTEIEKLLDDLKKCSLPYTCPHGRPTQVEIGLNELEKMFRRK